MRKSSFRGLSTALLGGLSLLLLASCNSDVVDPALEGNASITVLDVATALPVEGVKVEVLGSSSATTGDEGEATVKGLRVGTHQVRVSKKGFESSIYPLYMEYTEGENVVALNVSEVYPIHRLGPAIKGRLLIQPEVAPDSTAISGAAGVTVRLLLGTSGRFANGVRTTVTDSNGYYVFAELPEGANYTMSVPQFTRFGKRFRLNDQSLDLPVLLGSDTVQNVQSILFPAGASGILEVFPRSTRLEANQGWVFEFSNAIDTSKFSSTSAIQLSANGLGITSTRAWSQGFTVLTVRPATGTWVAGTEYSLSLFGVEDVLGHTLFSETFFGTRPEAP